MRVDTQAASVTIMRSTGESEIYEGLLVWRDDGGHRTVQIKVKGTTIIIDADKVRKIIEKGQKK